MTDRPKAKHRAAWRAMAGVIGVLVVVAAGAAVDFKNIEIDSYSCSAILNTTPQP